MKKFPSPSSKILITIPFWEGDKWQAAQLAKLLADLEPRHSELADILFVRRFDCAPLTQEAMKYISRKFNVHQHRSARKETGWPMGCNGLFFGGLEFIYHMSESGKIPTYKAVFNMGADVVPLTRDWLDYLHQQWDFLPVNLRREVTSAGALIDGERPHINGDAFLFSGSQLFLRWLVKDVGGISRPAGWDWILAPDFQARGWANLPNVFSLWQTKTMSKSTATEWKKKGAVLIHGVKDDSLLKFARETLL